MIDIHSHILPGLDDGSGSEEESLEMARMAAASGTTDIVATPHANLRYRFQQEEVEAAIAALQAAAGPVPRIHYGCDFHLSWDNIQDAVAHPGRYSINHKGYLLVEFSDLAIFHTTTGILEQLLAAGLVPIITHPERNLLLQQRMQELERWVELGCLIQVTGQSYLGRFGSRARQFAEKLTRQGLVHFAASDAHDRRDRPPVLDRVRQHLERRHGADLARRLLEEHPRMVLEGKPIDRGFAVEASPERKWYRFWGGEKPAGGN